MLKVLPISVQQTKWFQKQQTLTYASPVMIFAEINNITQDQRI